MAREPKRVDEKIPRKRGRKKGTPNKNTRELKALISEHTETLFNELLRLATKADSEAVRVSAIKELLERGFGKVPQAVTGEGGTGPVMLQIVTGVPRDDK